MARRTSRAARSAPRRCRRAAPRRGISATSASPSRQAKPSTSRATASKAPLVVADEVHLVHAHDHLRDAQQLGDRRVAARLVGRGPCGRRRGSAARSAVEAPVTMLRVYCACPGVSATMNAPARGGEVAVGDVDRDALLALGPQPVGDERQVEALAAAAARDVRRRGRAGRPGSPWRRTSSRPISVDLPSSTEPAVANRSRSEIAGHLPVLHRGLGRRGRRRASRRAR